MFVGFHHTVDSTSLFLYTRADILEFDAALYYMKIEKNYIILLYFIGNRLS